MPGYMKFVTILILLSVWVAESLADGGCIRDGCELDQYCNTTTDICELCRVHENACQTRRQQPECVAFCYRLFMKQMKETRPCSPLPELENGSYIIITDRRRNHINVPDLTNGSSTGRRWNQSHPFGERVNVTCNTGYHVRGEPDNTCGTYGQWQNQFATCESNVCSIPMSIPHGKVILPEDTKTLTYDTTVTYKCDVGFDLVGPKTSVCTADGQWNTSPPSCHRKECEFPHQIANGHHNGSSRLFFGDVLEFVCMDDFRLEGSKLVTCQADGTWDAVLPVCQAIQCSKPPGLMNGYLKGDGRFLVRTSVIYFCNKGYDLKGHAYRIWECLDSGDWNTNMVPMCIKIVLEEKKCKLPVQVLHGRHNATHDSEPGHTVEFTCEDTYKLDGDRFLTCHNDGNWDSTFPTCTKISCNAPVTIKNGGIVETNRSVFHAGEFVNYVCHNGYDMIDPIYSAWTCTIAGTWNQQQTPICVKQTHDYCSYLPTIVCTIIVVALLFGLYVFICYKFKLHRKLIKKISNYYQINADNVQFGEGNIVTKQPDEPVESTSETSALTRAASQ